MSKFIPSANQQKFFDWISNGTGSAVLTAVAGSGKTTTLIHGLSLMEGRIFFGAYNKKIADEIAERAGSRDGLFVSTMHSAGLRMLRQIAKTTKIDSNKCKQILRKIIADNQGLEEDIQPLFDSILNLVSLAKQAGIGVLKSMDDDAAWLELIEHYDIETLNKDADVIHFARTVLKKSVALDTVMIDFDDMIYSPLYHKVKAYTYDWVLIDEAQDTNATRRALALTMLKRGGRLIAVGDPHQAIYGFTGADSNSLDLIKQAVSAIELPLTVTYRCPKAVVRHAQQWVSHIQAHDSAPEGKVTVLPENAVLKHHVQIGDVILCRFNAPLIEIVYEFIADGIPAKVEGRDIGEGLKKLVTRWKARSFAALTDAINNFQERETVKYRAKEQESRAVSIEDKVKCLHIMIQRTRKNNPNATNPVEAVCAEIDSIFADNIRGGYVLLSSIHKSKGREFDRVFSIDVGPSPWARKDWELEQEKNLKYVEVTRAKKEFVIFYRPKKK